MCVHSLCSVCPYNSPSDLCKEGSLESHELRDHLLSEVLEVGGLYHTHGLL